MNSCVCHTFTLHVMLYCHKLGSWKLTYAQAMCPPPLYLYKCLKITITFRLLLLTIINSFVALDPFWLKEIVLHVAERNWNFFAPFTSPYESD